MKCISLSKLVVLGLLTTFSFYLAGCGGEVEKKSGFSLPSVGDGDGGGDGVTGGTVSANSLYLKVRDLDFPVTTLLHKFRERDSLCEIAPSASPTYAQCLLNVREQDLHSGGLKLEFNSPKSMCAFTAYRPYWYWNKRPGVGSPSITMSRNAAGTGGSCTATGSTTATFNATTSTCTFDEGTANMEGAVSCVYGACCTGNYSVSASQAMPPIAGVAQPPEVKNFSGSYGGDWGACVGTPAGGDSGWTVNKSGFPYVLVQPAGNGVNKYFSITAPIELESATNVYAANMANWASYSGTGAYVETDGQLGLESATDISGDDTALPHVAYTFICYDESREVKHIVDLYVNEWDSNVEFAKYQNRDPAANPASTTTNCGPIPERCNDVMDWKSFSGFPNESLLAD